MLDVGFHILFLNILLTTILKKKKQTNFHWLFFPDKVKKASVVSCVLDSEAVAWDHEKQQIQPFQVLTTRKRKVQMLMEQERRTPEEIRSWSSDRCWDELMASKRKWIQREDLNVGIKINDVKLAMSVRSLSANIYTHTYTHFTN